MAVDVPLLAGLFQLLIHADRACLRGASNGKFHCDGRQTEQQQTQRINEHKAAAAILAAHPRELPHVAAADCTAGGKQNESQPGAELFSFHEYALFLAFKL